MKHLRKIMPLLLGFSLGVGTMTPAFAADNPPASADTQEAAVVGLSVDPKITVTGFESGDTVTAYQFITWVDGEGWKLADGITGITIDDITDELTVSELATLASKANVAKMTQVTGTTSGTTWEKTCGTQATAGSYLILVSSGEVTTVYNPAVVSADFDGTNDAAVDLTEDEAMIKKQPITLDKVADDIANDNAIQVGDVVPFTVYVTVPQYNTNWTEPYFAVSDVLSTGLTIETVPTIEGLTSGTDYTITDGGTKGASKFTITFSETYLKENPTAQIAIKYSAKVGEAVKDTEQVHEETNKATLEFSNDPTDVSKHKTIDDETHHYTFAIDATRLGQGSEKTNELIKVGVDANGEAIIAFNEGEELPTGVTPLEGAEFTLTGTGANGEGTVTLTATSDSDGRVFFNNLDEGEYTLQETKAPKGYNNDQTSNSVVVDAEFNDDTTLKSYTITIDGDTTSTYTATTNAEEVVTYEAPVNGNNSFPINNKKGTELPSTGGIGTTIFYIVGGGMVVGAVVFLLTKRRMAGNE
jgi:fimbrial isopeptide formation D2 family protein/LPXTG-motif cell wall-anchored protein